MLAGGDPKAELGEQPGEGVEAGPCLLHYTEMWRQPGLVILKLCPGRVWGLQDPHKDTP